MVFHFVSGTPEVYDMTCGDDDADWDVFEGGDHPETPEKEGLVSKKTIHWMNFAS